MDQGGGTYIALVGGRGDLVKRRNKMEVGERRRRKK